MKEENTAKFKFFKEFDSIGGVEKNIKKIKLLKKKIDNHLTQLGDDDHRLIELSTLLEFIYTITDNPYNSENYLKSSEKVQLIINRLLYKKMENWDKYDLLIAQVAITYTNKIDEIDKFAKKFLSALKEVVKDKPTAQIEIPLYVNILICLLNISFVKKLDETEYKQLKKLFKKYSALALKTCDMDIEQFQIYECMINIRIALFDKDSDSVITALKILKNIKTKSPHYEFMKKEIIKHSTKFKIEELKIDQLKIIIGGNIMAIREKNNFSKADLAEVINTSDSYIGLVERGERSISIDKLLRIASFLNVPYAQLIEGEFKKKN